MAITNLQLDLLYERFAELRRVSVERDLVLGIITPVSGGIVSFVPGQHNYWWLEWDSIDDGLKKITDLIKEIRDDCR
jgi:hypothetical protein